MEMLLAMVTPRFLLLNIDKLAKKGLRFTDAHCAASTCSPSRYSLLTGEMGYRRKLGIQEVNAPLALDTNQYTIADLFKASGFRTGIIGKWHLGLGLKAPDWNAKIGPGPESLGFDHSFIMPSTNDRSPFVYLRNGFVVNADPNDPITVSTNRIPDDIVGTKYPDALLNPESITVYNGDKQHSNSVISGVPRIGYMKGGKKALWNDEDIADVFADEAKDFITSAGKSPFFLFFSTSDIHAPRLPNPRFKGKSKYGYRGDNILQLDDCVGKIMKILEHQGIVDETLVIFSSDNGPVMMDGDYKDGSTDLPYAAAGIFRGGKYQIYEGGNRVPFIVRWPAGVKAGVTDALFTQVDLLASFAAILGVNVPTNQATDSRNYWKTLVGKDRMGAKFILEQNNSGSEMAYRLGNMKYILRENGKDEMYDLEVDPSEKNDIILKQPKVAKNMKIMAVKYRGKEN